MRTEERTAAKRLRNLHESRPRSPPFFSFSFAYFRVLRSLSCQAALRLLISRRSSGGVDVHHFEPGLTNRDPEVGEIDRASVYPTRRIWIRAVRNSCRPFSHASDPFPPSDPPPRSIDPDSWLCPVLRASPFLFLCLPLSPVKYCRRHTRADDTLSNALARATLERASFRERTIKEDRYRGVARPEIFPNEILMLSITIGLRGEIRIVLSPLVPPETIAAAS